MTTDRINARLSKALADHVGRLVGRDGLYETSSEYVRDLIRRDMENRNTAYIKQAIGEGYRDIAAGQYFKSTGDFKKDMARLRRKDKAGWK